MSKIRIEQVQGTPHFRVFIDDMDVSRWSKNVGIKIGVDMLPEVTLTLVPKELSIPPLLEALITAEREENL